MKRILFLIPLILILLIDPAQAAIEPLSDWQSVAKGIDYQEFNLPDPNNVFVTRMDRTNPDVTIESSIGQGRLSGGLEIMSDQAIRYDQAINYWGQTWGNRNQVVAAINGFYFGSPWEADGVPWDGQVQSGWYAKRFWQQADAQDTRLHRGFAWKFDRSAFIGECITHPADKQRIDYFRNSSWIDYQLFDGVNVSRGSNQLILYTPQYDQNTGTSNTDSLEVVVQLTRPAGIVLYGNMTMGKILDIREKGSTPIQFDQVILSLTGTKRADFLDKGIKKGDEVGISQKVKKCDNSQPYDYEDTYAGIGGAFFFLKDGVIQDFSDDNQANVRDPRTAIAYNDSYVFFIVVDGRDKYKSVGMTIDELAYFAKDTLGATNGIAQDGGGSSTMVVNGEVVNNTFCNNVSCNDPYHSYLPLSTNGRRRKTDETDKTEPPAAALSLDGVPLTTDYYSFDQPGVKLQRYVANGMMMVVVLPKEQSTMYITGDAILALTEAVVRLGPGTNYAAIETVPSGTTGLIQGQDNSLNGMLAKGDYWWKVLLEVGDRDVIGWVSETSIAKLNP